VVDAARALELAEGAVVAATVAGRACVFLAGLHRAEQGIAERLSGLLAGSPPWPAVDPDQAIPWAERKAGITLADSQREAVRLALRAKVLVITGGPGVARPRWSTPSCRSSAPRPRPSPSPPPRAGPPSG
jgi:exodeoxyribonuclease V alpha subunit